MQNMLAPDQAHRARAAGDLLLPELSEALRLASHEAIT